MHQAQNSHSDRGLGHAACMLVQLAGVRKPLQHTVLGHGRHTFQAHTARMHIGAPLTSLMSAAHACHFV